MHQHHVHAHSLLFSRACALLAEPAAVSAANMLCQRPLCRSPTTTISIDQRAHSPSHPHPRPPTYAHHAADVSKQTSRAEPHPIHPSTHPSIHSPTCPHIFLPRSHPGAGPSPGPRTSRATRKAAWFADAGSGGHTEGDGVGRIAGLETDPETTPARSRLTGRPPLGQLLRGRGQTGDDHSRNQPSAPQASKHHGSRTRTTCCTYTRANGASGRVSLSISLLPQVSHLSQPPHRCRPRKSNRVIPVGDSLRGVPPSLGRI